MDPDYASAMTRPFNPNNWNNTFVTTSQAGKPESSIIPGKNMAWYSYLHNGYTNDTPAVGACYCTDANCNDLPLHCTSYTGPSYKGHGKCTGCDPQYTIWDGKCVPCHPHCEKCTADETSRKP